MKTTALKNVELKLISELMKNSRRSDRELAKAIGISQPTVSRLIKKLEQEGCIKEYTMMPDFNKIGYKILALTFVKLGKGITDEEIEKARKIAQETLKKGPFEIIMLERGMGLESNGVIISYHEDYSSYARLRSWLRQFAFLGIDKIESYLIDLQDKVHYRPLTFSTIANHVLTLKEESE